MSVRVEHIGDATLMLGDCREILPSLQGVQAIISDPPYGMGWNTDSTRYSGGNHRRGQGIADRGQIINDDQPFDPQPWLGYQNVILWGANHYAARLPVGTTLVWIKRYDQSFGSFLSDAEIGWQKGGYGVYCQRDLSVNYGPAMANRLHPTQKPLGIMQWCVGRTAGLVLDPYMGSGTTIEACISMARPCIGIEIDPHYFDIACKRIENAYRQPDLFIPPPKQARVESLPLFADTTGGPR